MRSATLMTSDAVQMRMRTRPNDSERLSTDDQEKS